MARIHVEKGIPISKGNPDAIRGLGLLVTAACIWELCRKIGQVKAFTGHPSLLGILPITGRTITSSEGPVLRITKDTTYMIARQRQILGKQSADSLEINIWPRALGLYDLYPFRKGKAATSAFMARPEQIQIWSKLYDGLVSTGLLVSLSPNWSELWLKSTL